MTVVDITHPDDLGMTQAVFDRGILVSKIQVFDKRYRTKDGKGLWVRLRSSAVRDESGAVIHRIVMSEDITAAKENELFLEQMAAIVDTSDDAIFRSSTSGILQFWSRGAENLYGYKAEEVLGKRLNFIAADESHQKVAQVAEKLMRGEVVNDPAGLARHKNGQLLHVSVQLFPVKNSGGETVAFAAVHRDMRELKNLEEQLRHSQRMETAGLLAGGIAHDFNNILTVILGSCSALAAAIPQGAPSASYLELIERSAEKASRLTRQLLAFSRKQKVAPQLLNCSALLRDSTNLLQRTLGDSIELVWQLASTRTICEDPTQLEQIILNLCVNARHAMPNGGVLTITTRDINDVEAELLPVPGFLQIVVARPGLGSQVMIEIADTGQGMDEAVLAHIFEPFFTTKPRGEGTGLGLAVVYGVVTQSKGGIVVFSSRELGSIFRIFLPQVSGEATAVNDPQKGLPGTRGKGRILVIEDDKDVRTLITAILRNAGYTVQEVASPQPLLERGLEAPVDLILSDVVMPHMSGPDFARIWRAQHPDARFLFMSGYFDEKKYPDVLRADNLLLKPFKTAELLQRIAQKIRQQTP